jgi:hypothetical protein
MTKIGKDREGRPIHKGCMVDFNQAGLKYLGIVCGSISAGEGLQLIMIRPMYTHCFVYVFEREIIEEVGNRLEPAAKGFQDTLKKWMGL